MKKIYKFICEGTMLLGFAPLTIAAHFDINNLERDKNIKIIKEIENIFEYELPKNLVGIIWKGKFRGQKQKWFITRFLGQDTEINLNTRHPEFIKWKWLEPEKLPDVIVDFKKNLYLKLLKEIKLVID